MINLRSVPIETFGEEFALSIGGLLVAYRLFEFNRRRKVLSEIIEELNELNKKLQSERTEFYLLNSRIHSWQLKVGAFMTGMAVVIGIPQAAFAIYSGQIYYNHFFPVDTSEFSVAYFIVWAFQSFTVISCCTCSSLQECTLVDWFIQLSLNYYTLNRKAEELRSECGGEIDEEVEYQKLIEIIKLDQQLER